MLGAAVPGLISFAAGYPAPDVFPWEDLRAITSDLLERHDGNTLQYGATRGYRPLIEHLRADTLKRRGIDARVEEMIITTGSQQGLDLAGRVLIDPGDVVLVELPTYSGAIAAFHNLQAQLVGVEQDAEGLESRLARPHDCPARGRGQARQVRVRHAEFPEPGRPAMSRARRTGLLEAAARHDLVILEDDPYGSIYFDDATREEETRPIKSDDRDGRVVYLGSISKTLVPGFRVAWLIAPEPIAQKWSWPSRPPTSAPASSISGSSRRAGSGRGQPQSRRNCVRTTRASAGYGTRDSASGSRDASRGPHHAAVSSCGSNYPTVSTIARSSSALDHKVSFVIGSAFFVNGAGHQFARLSFSGITPTHIEEGVERLAAAIAAS